MALRCDGGRAKRRAEEADDLDVTIHIAPAEDFEVADDERFDVVSCVGASWIWNGWEGTLDALVGFAKPGGLVVAGEPYWMREPDPTYLASQELTAEQFPSLAAYAEGVWGRGHSILWMRGASREDWDRYEMDQGWALDRWARENADHPDLEAIRARHIKDKRDYLTTGRETLGFALWVMRTAEK